jgi:protein TonB
LTEDDAPDAGGSRLPILVSILIHVSILTLVIVRLQTPRSRSLAEAPETALPAERARVFLPPPEVLRQLAPPPRPAPPPPPVRGKDRISVGPPSEERQKRLLLRREDDLTAPPGSRTPGEGPVPPTPPPTPAPAAAAAGADASARGGAVPLPPGGVQPAPPPDQAPGSRQGSGRSLADSLRNLDRHVGSGGLGAVGGRRIGPLFFDPEGADFTEWVNHFKNEVYRNWLPPQSVLLGFRGHVDIEFAVERDGRITGLSIVKSSGTPSLDRAAVNALLASRLMPLPADYAPARAPMQVSFFYNEEPQGS